MTDPIQSKYSALYKNSELFQELEIEKQKVRREQLLGEQKSLRAAQHDNYRNLDDFIEKLQKNKFHRPQYKRKCFDENPLQLSEWMKGRPNDLDQWFLVPCPKGQRCLLVATNGKTEMYNKYGYFVKSFHTNLPGDQRAKQQVTILDCIRDWKTKRIFVLDMMAYGSQDMANCDTQFRFYWVTTKIAECEAIDSNHNLVPLLHYDMADELSVTSCLERFPQFENNSPHLDGFLFYHKEASYTYGKTPLVLWLFAFMIPEMLGYDVHPTYMMDKPEEYVDYRHFIAKFDEAMSKKPKPRQTRVRMSNLTKMDEDQDLRCDDENGDMDDTEIREDGCELAEIIDQERILETDECIESPT